MVSSELSAPVGAPTGVQGGFERALGTPSGPRRGPVGGKPLSAAKNATAASYRTTTRGLNSSRLIPTHHGHEPCVGRCAGLRCLRCLDEVAVPLLHKRLEFNNPSSDAVQFTLQGKGTISQSCVGNGSNACIIGELIG